jgi:hypothetical protein
MESALIGGINVTFAIHYWYFIVPMLSVSAAESDGSPELKAVVRNLRFFVPQNDGWEWRL